MYYNILVNNGGVDKMTELQKILSNAKENNQKLEKRIIEGAKAIDKIVTIVRKANISVSQDFKKNK